MPILEWLLPALILLGALVLTLARRRGRGGGAATTRAAAAGAPREDLDPPRFRLSPPPAPEPLPPLEPALGPRAAASPLAPPTVRAGAMVVPNTRRRLRGLLRDPRGRRVAILAHEILRRPVGLGGEQGRLPSDQPERR